MPLWLTDFPSRLGTGRGHCPSKLRHSRSQSPCAMVLVSPRRHTRRIALLLAPGVYAYPGNSCWRIVYGRCGINATTTVAQNRTFISTPVAFFRAHTLILSTGLDPVSYRVTHGLTLARAAPPFISPAFTCQVCNEQKQQGRGTPFPSRQQKKCFPSFAASMTATPG